MASTSDTQKEVVIIGGSLAGLFTAISLKSLASITSITILERYQIQDLQDLGAGIRCNQEANDAIQEYAGISPEKYANFLTKLRFLDKDGNIAAEQPSGSWATTWGQLYRTFRDVVDADPKCTYNHGCKLINLEDGDEKGKVHVKYQDESQGEKTILADIVIGADGASSKVRSLLDVGCSPRTSAGYVLYRGVIPKGDISPTALDIFDEAGAFVWPPASQFLSYMVPSNEISADKSGRCINWVWYRNKTEDEFKSLMTDTSGVLHKFSLPHGRIKADEVQKLLEAARQELPALCVEIMEKTESPFVQVVTDSMASKTSFFDGKVLLVGDAVGGQRPHTASAVLQGTHHALLIRQYLESKIDASELERVTTKVSRILVDGGQELGKIVMSTAPRTPASIPSYMKTYVGIQTELNVLWRETIGIGDTFGKM